MPTPKGKAPPSTPSAAGLRFLVNHIILPPNLPQQSDGSAEENRILLAFVAGCAATYPEKEKHPQWAVVTKMLESLLRLRSNGSIPSSSLKSAIRGMKDQDVIPLNIAAQNAGLIIRHMGEEIQLESFELSPTAGKVMETTGRLTCSFPGPVMAVWANKIQNSAFLDELVSFLERMDREVLESAMPSTIKAGCRVMEERDTASPMFITGMLAGIFRAIGAPVGDALRIQKQVRDDVIWSKAKLPWRRSSLWLLIRVAIQTTVQEASGLYKSFMIHLISRLLNLAERGSLGSDTLFVMRAKLSRRVEKVGGELPKSVFQGASSTIRSVSDRLCRNWKLEQKQKYSHPSLEGISVEADTEISPQNGQSYIAGIAGRPDISGHPQGICPPGSAHRTGRDPNLLPDIKSEAALLPLALFDFERWVECSLDGWLNTNLRQVEICRQLADIIDRYTTAAKIYYKSKPGDLSVMLLTAAMLWVALDTAAVHHCPLLRKYRPEVPRDALEPLILPKKTQMQALYRVEKYILKRERECILSNPSIYSDEIVSDTFAVSYCTSSSRHKILHERIEKWAKGIREEKKEEFRRDCVRHQKLLDQINQTTCDCYYKRQNLQVCRHHQLVSEADSIRIGVHEWPLPQSPLPRWVVIFELDCPPAFCAWRDATYKILAEVFAVPSATKSSKEAYGDFRQDGLSQYFSDHGQRITLKSSTKSFLKSHYRCRNFPTNIGEICVESGLKYHLHDGKGWVADQLGNNSVRSMCTPALPDGIYRSLQWVVKGTTHVPNEVIARQSERHPELLNHEYDAFGLLRSGYRLQWLNIARELRARNLSFGQEAVNVLILHAAWQAGPNGGSDIRQAHFHLVQPEFGTRLIDELGVFWDSIQGNWLEVVGANTLVRLTSRLLSLAIDPGVKRKASDLLRKARSITLDWARQVAELAGKQIDQDTLKTLRSRIIIIAATCRATYDVDDADLSGVLSSDDDVATAAECAIMIQRNMLPGNVMLSEWTCRLLERDRRLSYELEPKLRTLILAGNGGLNKAIIQTGYSFIPGTRWRSRTVPDERWLFMETLASPGKHASNVYYNLFDGVVLIDGSPLGRLPESFTAHETYFRTFGNNIFDAFPSDRSDMKYRLSNRISGYEVYLRMHKDELVIQTAKAGTILELIPFKKLLHDFPARLVDGCSHWYDRKTEEIEFRPLVGNQWEESKANWRLTASRKMPSKYMKLHDDQLVDVRSQTAVLISRALSPIEAAEHIEISVRKATNQVSVRLPRLKLDFFINESRELECRQFRGTIVDRDQSIGAFYGLSNRLVLREKESGKGYHARKVIIPYGRVKYRLNGQHVQVDISTSQGEGPIQYHVYDIDTKLGRLEGNGSLASRYFKILLHATTSHCLPDPLTGRTGTEEALYGLHEAASWSFQSLSPIETELLHRIAELTPPRQFYPPHLRVMQEVKWNNSLPSLSQHEGFERIVLEILEHNASFDIFRAEVGTSEFKPKSQAFLLERAALRAAPLRPEEFGGALISKRKDQIYIARDTSDDRAALVTMVARFTQDWSSSVPVHPGLMDELEKWDNLDQPGPIDVGYNSQWLEASLDSKWLSLYDTCRRLNYSNRYRLLMLLCTLTYSGRVDMQLVWTLLAFATEPGFLSESLPDNLPYNLGFGFRAGLTAVEQAIRSTAVPYEDSSESEILPSLKNEFNSLGGLETWRHNQYEGNLYQEVRSVASQLLAQWPCSSPSPPPPRLVSKYRLLSISRAMEMVTPLFHEWYRNKLFMEHIGRVQQILSQVRNTTPGVFKTYIFQPRRQKILPTRPPTCMGDLLRNPIPETLPNVPKAKERGNPRDDGRLNPFILSLKEESEGWDKKYACDLQKSFKALHHESQVEGTTFDTLDTETLADYRDLCLAYMTDLLRTIRSHLELAGADETQELMRLSGLHPRITPTSILKLLVLDAPDYLGNQAGEPGSTSRGGGELGYNPKFLRGDGANNWKSIIIQFGEAVTMLQRAERLHALALSGNEADFAKENENIGHRDWDPMKYPRSLLMEIDNDLLLRPVQSKIVSEMMHPSSGGNIVLQLNMGEGKSSVIVPIVTAELADGKKLVRVVVLKPLSTQMFHLLVQKLGRLVGRRIYYMPFSRDIKMGKSTAERIRTLYEQCMKTGSILLVQPEHLLSFKLMGLECLSHDKEVAHILLDTQSWLVRHARDVLDESDEILNVRYQLVYALGGQRTFEHQPDRWVLVQQLFGIIKKLIQPIANKFPGGVEIEGHDGEKTGSYPTIRILHCEAGKALLKALASEIRQGGLPSIHFRFFPPTMSDLAERFIRDRSMGSDESKGLLNYLEKNGASRATFMLLRGLIAHGVVISALRDKRWRVDYGLDPRRSMLAVPYRAKDCPAVRAEFSHPDVAVTLTCLSYYYGGLTDQQLEACFRALMRLDNPRIVYEGWLVGCRAVEDRFKTLQGVNLGDHKQREDLFALLRRNKLVADFFLSTFAFPREAKEFPYKLLTSGWDIAEEREHPTTGFSGTNDNRYLLPLSISQHDLPELLSTNAEVLHNLLQPENNFYCCANRNGSRLDVRGLLELVVTELPSIHVILDVGAQVLELGNREVVQLWLKMVTPQDAQAAVFFNKDDELVVLSRDDTEEPLMTSSFAGRLDQCLVYLDEVHTRGTDLKLPQKSRAAVTLGPRLVKDRLVQACMRMRKLGHGQAVMFFAPPEVNDQILSAVGKNNGDRVDTIDVVRWAIAETCTSTRSAVPLWASQGLSYQSAQEAWLGYRTGGQIDRSAFALPDAQTLEEMYGFQAKEGPDPLHAQIRNNSRRMEEILNIRKKCVEFGVESLLAVRQYEEQEREVSHEAQREQQVQRPPMSVPCQHVIHSGLFRFVNTGLIEDQSVFLKAFPSLAKFTSAGKSWVGGWDGRLRVTNDFVQTVKSTSHLDNYLNSVNWVLSTTESGELIVISPFEANELINSIMLSRHVRLHIYAPRVTNSMKPFEDLSFLTLPYNSSLPALRPAQQSLIAQLSLFAGQLFLRDFAAYKDVCKFLGLYTGSGFSASAGNSVKSDGFVAPLSRPALGVAPSPFNSSPMPFLSQVMALRRKGQDFGPTHIGKVLRGHLLDEKDFQN